MAVHGKSSQIYQFIIWIVKIMITLSYMTFCDVIALFVFRATINIYNNICFYKLGQMSTL